MLHQLFLELNGHYDVAIVVFIVELQTDYFFYKHLVKHDITSMKDILSQAQKHVHLDARPLK